MDLKGKTCIISLFIPPACECGLAQCSAFIEDTQTCRFIYLLDRICYVVPQFGNWAEKAMKSELVKYNAALKYKRETAKEAEEGPL